jgi:hypothetical protein
MFVLTTIIVQEVRCVDAVPLQYDVDSRPGTWDIGTSRLQVRAISRYGMSTVRFFQQMKKIISPVCVALK